jgi:hypothetical protein
MPLLLAQKENRKRTGLQSVQCTRKGYPRFWEADPVAKAPFAHLTPSSEYQKGNTKRGIPKGEYQKGNTKKGKRKKMTLYLGYAEGTPF